MKCAHVLIVAFSISSLGCELGSHPSGSTGESTGAENWEPSDEDIETDQSNQAEPHTESGDRGEAVDEDPRESPDSESRSQTPDESTTSDEEDSSDVSLGESGDEAEDNSSTMTGAADDTTGETDDVSALDPDACFAQCTQGPLETHVVDTNYCGVYHEESCLKALCKSTANRARYIAIGQCWEDCGELHPDDGSIWDGWSIESELNGCKAEASARVSACLMPSSRCDDGRLAIGLCTSQIDELLQACEREANEQG